MRVKHTVITVKVTRTHKTNVTSFFYLLAPKQKRFNYCCLSLTLFYLNSI